MKRFCVFTGVLALAVAGVPAVGLGQDGGEKFSLTTLDGRSYEGCEVLKVDPDGLFFSHSQGMAKIGFEDLPEDVREKHGFDPEKAKEFIEKHSKPAEPEKPAESANRGPVNAAYGSRINVNALGAVGGGWGWGWGLDAFGYGAGYGYAGYWDNGNYYHGNHRNRVFKRPFGFAQYPVYPFYPNISWQSAPEQRFGSPVAPSLISSNRYMEQLRAVQAAAGYPEPRIPFIRPAFNPQRAAGIGSTARAAFAPVRSAHRPIVRPTPLPAGGRGGMRGGGGGGRR